MKPALHYLCLIAKLRGHAEQEDRVPPRASAGDETSWREEFKFWKSPRVTHVTVNSAFERTTTCASPRDDGLGFRRPSWSALAEPESGAIVPAAFEGEHDD